jgi:hypothetical protein
MIRKMLKRLLINEDLIFEFSEQYFKNKQNCRWNQVIADKTDALGRLH